MWAIIAMTMGAALLSSLTVLIIVIVRKKPDIYVPDLGQLKAGVQQSC
jgi:hypothetical protein